MKRLTPRDIKALRTRGDKHADLVRWRKKIPEDPAERDALAEEMARLSAWEAYLVGGKAGLDRLTSEAERVRAHGLPSIEPVKGGVGAPLGMWGRQRAYAILRHLSEEKTTKRGLLHRFPERKRPVVGKYLKRLEREGHIEIWKEKKQGKRGRPRKVEYVRLTPREDREDETLARAGILTDRRRRHLFGLLQD